MDNLCLVLDSSLQSWEREYFHALGLRLQAEVQFRQETPRQSKLNPRREMWFVSRRWREWAHSYAASGVCFTPLGHYTGSISVLEHLRGKVLGDPPAHVLTHSSLSQRFFTEVDQRQGGVSWVELPYLPIPSCLIKRESGPADSIRVAVLSDYDTESNLGALLSVAHYVRRKGAPVEFVVRGQGRLLPHFLNQISELGLQSIVQVNNGHEPLACDLLFHLPLRSEHFIPIFEAGTVGVPVLSHEMTGIHKWIRDSHSGFFVPVHDTKTAGELICRFATDVSLRDHLGQKLRANCLENQWDADKLSAFRQVFSSISAESKSTEQKQVA